MLTEMFIFFLMAHVKLKLSVETVITNSVQSCLASLKNFYVHL